MNPKPNPTPKLTNNTAQRPPTPPSPSPWAKGMRLMAVGLEVAVAILFSLWVGQWMDLRLGSTPWMLIVCLLVGMVAAVKILMRLR